MNPPIINRDFQASRRGGKKASGFDPLARLRFVVVCHLLDFLRNVMANISNDVEQVMSHPSTELGELFELPGDDHVRFVRPADYVA